MAEVQRRRKRMKSSKVEETLEGGLSSLVLTSEGRDCHFNERLAKLWKSESMCDVSITVDNQTFAAHRLALAAGSDYMKALLSKDRFKDSNKDVISLGDDVTAPAFGLILEWIYEGRCKVSESMFVDLLRAASRLQCLDLVGKIEDAMVEKLEQIDNLMEAWEMAEQMHLPKLTKAAETQALKCYGDLVGRRSEFCALSFARLSKLISNKNLVVEKEEEVFESILVWARSQNTPPSNEDLGKLFEHVRFPLMQKDYLVNVVDKEPMLLNNTAGMLSFARGMRDKAFQIPTERTAERCVRTCTWEDIQPGVKVRIKNNLEHVKALCEATAPGAACHAGWSDDNMESFIGRIGTIKEKSKASKSVYLFNYHWPFNALEL